MPYAYLNYAQARQAVATRLDDSANVYWSDNEIKLYFAEALRTWQAFSRYWRGRMTFPLANNYWYDLTQQPNTLIPYTLKDTDINSILAWHLIETQPSGAFWTGTDMFSMNDLIGAVQRRRDQFLLETGMVTSVGTVTGIKAPSNIIQLPDSVIDVRRLAWNDSSTNQFSTLWVTDEWRAQAILPSWSTSPGVPLSYSILAQPPVQLQMIPPGINGGFLEYLAVQAGTPLNPAVGVLLGVPDNFAWVVKWGALADLLGREGQPNDPARQQYCEQRWQHGILAARAFSSLVTSYLDGTQVFPVALTDLDTMTPNWENSAPGQPTICAMASWNMLAVNPPPDSNPHSFLGDILQNAPIPANDSAYIQVSREELDVILDYVVHLASFKQGGSEFTDTLPLFQNFLRLAELRNARLAAASSAIQPMFDRSQQEEKKRYRREPELPEGIAPAEVTGGANG